MEKNQLAVLTKALDRREQELNELIASRRGDLATPPGITGPEVRDTGEDGVVRETQTRELGDLDRAERELGDIAHARLRIREGDYGTCEDCGVDIPFARLQAVPTARYCIRDEERHEKEALQH